MGVYAAEDYIIYIAILFIVVCIYLKVFERIKIDKSFLKAIAPYVFVGVFIRLLVDAKIVEPDKMWSLTPGVYLVTVLLASFFIAFGLLLKKTAKLEYWVVPFLSGTGIAAFLLYMLIPHMENPWMILQPTLLALFLTGAACLASAAAGSGLFRKISNQGIMFAHMLDASSTFIAYNFHGFQEEHLLPIYLISLAGDNAIVMIPVKFLIVAITLYLIERWYREEEKTEKSGKLYSVLKLLIFIIGMGPGVRNTMLLALR
ncbi:MAG: DUF63 family protein [Candidatus Altiarchaeota archaeon]|nr:DUF63 family protein [Candidatus Altiarchaeota archaeon]